MAGRNNVSVANAKVGFQIKGSAESQVTNLFFEQVSLGQSVTLLYVVNAINLYSTQCLTNGREVKQQAIVENEEAAPKTSEVNSEQ
jgi:hypothetical protein